MEKLFNDITALIMIYAPVLLTYVIQIVDWCIMVKSLKKVDVDSSIRKFTGGISADLKQVKMDLKLMIDTNKMLAAENISLKNEHITLYEKIHSLEENINNKLAEQNDILLDIINENIELKKQLKSKEA